jgi:hypothetical protein
MALTEIKTSGIADDAVTTDKLANAINTARDANTAKTTNATHSGDVTGSGSLTIADNAVTLAKMAAGTDGQIITYDASGNPTAVGPGTDGQVLTSTGAGSPPAFENIPAAGAALTGSTINNITTVTGANAIQGEANLTFTGSTLKLQADNGEFVVKNASGTDAISVDSDNGNTYIAGKVGIGDSTPTASIEILGHNQVTFGSMPETILSYGTTSAYDSGSAGSGINLGGKYNASDTTLFGGVHGVKENTTINNYAGALVFSTRPNGGNSTEKMRVGSNGNVTVSDGDLVIGTSGHGIDFSAQTAAGGMTAELLDHYEEGTWTPIAYRSTGGAISTSNSSYNGYYTRVGRLVNVSFYIYINTVTSQGSNAVMITGLPFSPVTAYHFAGNLSYNSAIDNTFVRSFTVHSDAGGSFYFFEDTKGHSLLSADWAVGYIGGNITYIV